MALAATPVSAAAEQQHDYDDNQEQFHGKPPPLVGRHLLARSPALLVKQRAQNQCFDVPDQFQRARDRIVPQSTIQTRRARLAGLPPGTRAYLVDRDDQISLAELGTKTKQRC
jgi:hypothetical protein